MSLHLPSPLPFQTRDVTHGPGAGRRDSPYVCRGGVEAPHNQALWEGPGHHCLLRVESALDPRVGRWGGEGSGERMEVLLKELRCVS